MSAIDVDRHLCSESVRTLSPEVDATDVDSDVIAGNE